MNLKYNPITNKLDLVGETPNNENINEAISQLFDITDNIKSQYSPISNNYNQIMNYINDAIQRHKKNIMCLNKQHNFFSYTEENKFVLPPDKNIYEYITLEDGLLSSRVDFNLSQLLTDLSISTQDINSPDIYYVFNNQYPETQNKLDDSQICVLYLHQITTQCNINSYAITGIYYQNGITNQTMLRVINIQKSVFENPYNPDPITN